MGNCLVTKLKSVVDNDNLNKLGILTIKAETVTGTMTAARCWLRIKTSETVKVSIVGGYNYMASAYADLSDPSKCFNEYTVTNEAKVLYFANNNYTIEVSNKYGLKDIGNNSYSGSKSVISIVDMNDLDYSTALETVQCEEWEGNGGNLSFIKNLDALRLLDLRNNYNVVGDMSEFSKKNSKTSLKDLKLSQCPKITGSINSLSDYTGLQTFLISHNKQISGDIGALSALSSLVDLEIPDTNIEGTLASAPTGLNTFYAYSSKISGNIADLAHCPNLDVFTTDNNRLIIGEMADLFNALAANQNRDFNAHPTLRLNGNGVLTFNGVVVPNTNDVKVTFDGHGGWSRTD